MHLAWRGRNSHRGVKPFRLVPQIVGTLFSLLFIFFFLRRVLCAILTQRESLDPSPDCYYIIIVSTVIGHLRGFACVYL